MKKGMRFFAYVGLILILCTCTQNPGVAYRSPDPNYNKVSDIGDEFDPQADILFVVDDSGSMGIHQSKLAAAVQRFTGAFIGKSILNFNIGVITTTATPEYGTVACCGVLAGIPNIITPTTPAAPSALARNLQVGTNGSYREAPFSAMLQALSSPAIENENLGFLRPKAALMVVFITDAEDQSSESPEEVLRFLTDLKGKNPDKLFLYGAIIPTDSVGGCDRDAYETPKRIEWVLNRAPNAPGNIFNICESDFGTQLADYARQLVEKTSRVIRLSRLPDVSSIQVQYGSIFLPRDADKGWAFDADENAVILGPNIDWLQQPFGSKVKVLYRLAEVPE